MILTLWRHLRAAAGHLGLALPLLAVGLTRHRAWIGVTLIGLGVGAALARARAPRLFRAIAAAYLAACVFLVVRTAEIVNSISTDAWPRVLLTGAAVAGVFLAGRRAFATGSRLARRFGEGRAELAGDLLRIAAAIAIIRLGQIGLWPNPGIVPGMAIAFPLLHFRPRPVRLVVFALCSVIAVFEWHGFMTTRYLEMVRYDPADGIGVEILRHGSPKDLQGARFFAEGQCELTRGAHYMGEMRRTYRLNPDGSELDLVTGVESVCSVIELCEEGVVITGSDEKRFLRFSDIRTGAVLADVPLRGQPTFSLLGPDRRHLYTSVINPGALVRTDLATRQVDREFTRFVQTDPAFSGINNLILQEGRIFGAYSSYFTLDDPPGHVFSVDLELGDYRELMEFRGSWGIVAPGPPGSIYFKIYSRPGLYQVRTDGSGADRVADIPAGYHYLVTLDRPPVVVLNHWSTGELVALCRPEMKRRFEMRFGSMGRPMTVFGNRVLMAVPAGYVTLTFPEDLCDRPPR